MLFNKAQVSLMGVLLGLTVIGGGVGHQPAMGLSEQSGLVGLNLSLTGTAWADVTAPQAPPELSDTLTDFRTKEQLTEQIYIEGKVDEQNSLQVPTAASDITSKVMRISALYQPQYEIAVPRYGVSVVRFYDEQGNHMEITDLKLDKLGYIAEKTAASYELLLRQFQGAEDNLLQVRFKKYRTPVLLKLRPLVVVNQHQPVRTLITSLTLNYNAEQNQPSFAPHRFTKPAPAVNAQIPNAPVAKPDFSQVNPQELEQFLVQGAMVVFPLTVSEQVDSQDLMDKLEWPEI